MLYYPGFLLVAALVVGTLGFGVLAGAGIWIPRVIFVVLMVLFVVSLARRKDKNL